MNNYIEFKVQREPYIAIAWQLSNICNYSCSYCLVKCQDYKKQYFPKSLDSFFNLIEKIKEKHSGKKILLTLSGGEPTLWRLFKPFIRKAKQHDIKIRLVTNGSRSIKWWKDIVNEIDYFIVSYHTEYHNKDHIIKLMSLVSQNKNIQSQINFMLKPKNFFKDVKLAEEISEKAKCFILFKLLRQQDNINLYNYTKEQFNYLENNRIVGAKYFNNNEYEYQIYSKCKDDSIIKHKNVNEVLIHKINQWKGWECTAGINAFTIDFNQDIYVCSQTIQQKGKIGNINNDYELPNKPFICETDVCTCLHDILDCNKKRL